MLETWVRFLNGEDPLDKGIDTHSSTLSWRIPRTEEPGKLQSLGSQRVRYDRVTHTHTHIHTWINYKRYLRDFPGNPVVKTSPFNSGAQVQSLFRELRSYMTHRQKKKIKQKQ